MLNPGDTIERYEVVRTVGIGGHATVYLLKHLTLGSEHALKVVNLHRPDIRARLLQEGRIQATLQHPSIVPVTDVLEVGGLQALVMPFVDGPDLGQWLERNHPIPTSTILHLFHEIVEAVGFAHSQGLVHRDLKPANILMDRQGDRWRPRITDFGIAKITGGQGAGIGTRSGIGMGTPAYMAPEQIQSAAHVDHRADIFALGCILYEFITGARLFTSASPLLIAAEIAGSTPVDLGAISQPIAPVLNTLLKGCLEKDRSRRFSDCDTILQTLQTHQGTPIQTSRPQSVPPAYSASTGTQTPAVPLAPMRTPAAPLTPHAPLAPHSAETAPDPSPSSLPSAARPPSPVATATTPFPPPRRAPRGVGLVVLAAVGLGLGGVWFTGGVGSREPQAPAVTRTATAPRPSPPVPAAAPPTGPGATPTANAPDPASGDAAAPADPGSGPPGPPPPSTTPPSATPPSASPAPPASATPPRPAAERESTGTLSLDSKPYSDIWLNGTAHGETWQELNVPTGTHEVRMKDAESREHTVTLKIEAGETVKYCWDFDVSAACSI